MSPRH